MNGLTIVLKVRSYDDTCMIRELFLYMGKYKSSKTFNSTNYSTLNNENIVDAKYPLIWLFSNCRLF